MDEAQDPPRPKGPAHTRAKNGGIAQRRAASGERSVNAAIAGRIINPNANAIRANVKAKCVVALDGLKRRHVKNLLGLEHIGFRNRLHILMVAKIGMPVAIGICYFRDDSPEIAVMVVGQPKTDRVEHMAQNARLRDEDQLSSGDLGQALGAQHVPNPNAASTLAGRAAMVAIPQRRQIAPISRKQNRPFGWGFGIQREIIDTVSERIVDRAAPPVEGRARYMIRPTHAASKLSCKRVVR